MLGASFASVAANVCNLSLFYSYFLFSYSVNILASNWHTHILLGLFFAIICYNVLFRHVVYVFGGLIKFIIHEISRQFNEIPFLFEHKAKPDLRRMTRSIISTCIHSFRLPSILLFLIPLCMCFVFTTQILFSFVFVLVFLSLNHSYSWAIIGEGLSHARRFIQAGHYGGKQSPNYVSLVASGHFAEMIKGIFSPISNMFIKAVVVIAMIITFLLN